MAFIDYYKILGVGRDIPQKDVREAYRKRAKQFHPDLHPNDPKAKAKFQALNEAYDVLSDPDKRAKYDRYGEQWKSASAFERGAYGAGRTSGSPFEGFDFSGFEGGGFSSFFQDMFGAQGFGGRHAGPSHGCGGCGHHGQTEQEAQVTIDLYTALLGGEVIIQHATGTRLRLKVNPCTQNGTKVRVRGQGPQRADGTAGDLIVCYHVQLPTQLSPRQRELLERMREA